MTTKCCETCRDEFAKEQGYSDERTAVCAWCKCHTLPVSEVIAEAVKEFAATIPDLAWDVHMTADEWLTTTLNRVASVAREELLESTPTEIYLLGATNMKEKIMAAVRNIKNTKPYKQGEDPRSTENKAGWNTCLTFVSELITDLK